MATISSQEAPQLQQIDLTKLNLQQLNQLKHQLDQVKHVIDSKEITVFQDSLQTLKMAQSKFQDSGESLEKIVPGLEGKQILVPLTGSMYVPGFVADPNKALIDIGTGYYATKDIDGAKDYFKRKVSFVTEQMEKIQLMGSEKSRIRETILEVMEMKMQETVKPATRA